MNVDEGNRLLAEIKYYGDARFSEGWVAGKDDPVGPSQKMMGRTSANALVEVWKIVQEIERAWRNEVDGPREEATNV